MNIHVTDDHLKNELFNSELIRIPFGSHVYGLNNQHSDEDYICIYAESDIERDSFLWEHHNYQIKENDTDYIFTTLNNFIRNLINGDMPGNLESIYDVSLTESPLAFLYDNRESFLSYSNIRSFLGYAKRDLKHSLRDDSRLCHAYRSVLSARKILDKSYDPYCKNWNEYDILKNMKEGNLSLEEKRHYCNMMNVDIDNMRSLINTMLENNQIIRFMKVEEMRKMDDWLLTVKGLSWYTDKAMVTNNHHKYQALELGIKY